jgi:hypothetical protein
MWESLEVDENVVWTDGIDLFHRQLDSGSKEEKRLECGDQEGHGPKMGKSSIA